MRRNGPWSRLAQACPEGCLIWDGWIERGQPCCTHKGERVLAQHLVWFEKHGHWPVPGVRLTCGNPLCMNIEHMELALTSHNGIRKLTEAQVADARRRYAAGEDTQASLAGEFAVSQSVIHYALTGRTFPHLPGAVKRKDRETVRNLNVRKAAVERERSKRSVGRTGAGQEGCHGAQG